MRSVATLATAVLSFAGACNRTSSDRGSQKPPEIPVLAAPTASVTIEAPRRAMFERARGGETIERVELARREGAAGLCEALGDPAVRSIALDALGYADGTEQLTPLCNVIKDGTEADATRAINAVAMIAARAEGVEAEAGAGLRCLKELVTSKPKSAPRLREAFAALEDAERQKLPKSAASDRDR